MEKEKKEREKKEKRKKEKVIVYSFLCV